MNHYRYVQAFELVQKALKMKLEYLKRSDQSVLSKTESSVNPILSLFIDQIDIQI